MGSQLHVRHDWFQSPTHVVISVFVKECSPDRVQLTADKQSVSVTIRSSTVAVHGREYLLLWNPLQHEILPSESSYSCGKVKIEVRLRKAVEGIHWTALEGSQAKPDTIEEGRPAYPSSARKPINWDCVERSVEDEKPQGEAALNSLFQQIYRDGTEETRRAMMKSFIESGGTCLSTNWNEVGAGKVPVKPPEGMEAKQWES